MKTFKKIAQSFIFCVLILIGFSTVSYGQDKLSFKDGNIEEVKIIKIDQYNKTIEYSKNNSRYVVVMFMLKKYYFEEKWIEVDVARESLHPVNNIWSYLKFRSPWSIGTNVSSALIGMLSDYEGPLLSDRPLITIEPEYRLENNLISIKGSVAIGVPFPSVSSYSQRYVNDTYNGLIEYGFTNQDYDQMIINDYYYNSRMRTRYVPFEAGLSLKLWPSERLRERFFIFAGVMMGQCDYQAITIYDTFEEYDNWGTPLLRISDQVIEVRNNPFVYTRFEGGVGYNFQISKSFTLSTDLCFTNKPLQNKGDEPDIVYARYETGPYEKVYESNYSTERSYYLRRWSNILVRFKFRYHFQKQ